LTTIKNLIPAAYFQKSSLVEVFRQRTLNIQLKILQTQCSKEAVNRALSNKSPSKTINPLMAQNKDFLKEKKLI
jgi:hypothetical protein